MSVAKGSGSQEGHPEEVFEACLTAPPADGAAADEACRSALAHRGWSALDFLSTRDDLTLVRAYKHGCLAREAFEVLLVRRRQERIAGFFRQHGLNTADTDDCLQTLYLKLYARGLASFSELSSRPADPAAAFDQWLFGGVAKRVMVDHYRRRGPAPHPSGAEVDPSPDADPAARAIRNEQAERLREALAALPEPQAALLRAYLRPGARLKDLADRSGLTVSKVWRLLREAKRAVKAAAQRPHPDEGAGSDTPPVP